MHIKVFILYTPIGWFAFESSEICPSHHVSVLSSFRHIKCRNSNNVNLGFVFFKCDALSVTILAVAKMGPPPSYPCSAYIHNDGGEVSNTRKKKMIMQNMAMVPRWFSKINSQQRRLPSTNAGGTQPTARVNEKNISPCEMPW